MAVELREQQWHIHRWKIVQNEWLYYNHDGYGGSKYWAPVALRDRITGVIRPIVPNLTVEQATEGWRRATISFGKGT